MNYNPVVIDTNIWSDLRRLLNIIYWQTNKQYGYKQVWAAMERDKGFIQRTLTPQDQETYRGVINTMNMIIEMKNSPNKYVIKVPSYVYNEAGRGASSKIGSPATGSNQFVNQFLAVTSSLPIQVEVDPTILNEGTDYPTKKRWANENIEDKMKKFLQVNKPATLNLLMQHLRNSDKTKRSKVRKRIKILKDRMSDVLHKRRNWDKFMTEASKIHRFPYVPLRTIILNSLYGSIRRYRDIDNIFLKTVPPGAAPGSSTIIQPQDPLDVLAERLTMAGEEYDFFDLQIYLYAKQLNAPIITKNTQAYQEINDPSFLGYFENVKILHPLINFNSLADLNSSGDLKEIIKQSVIKDFNDVDMQACREIDKQLTNPILEKEGRELIEGIIQSSYKSDDDGLNIDLNLGDVLKVLQIENNQLKVNRESFFNDDDHSIDINRIANTLKFIDKQLFNNKLTSSDFVKSPNINVGYVLKSKVLTDYLNNNPRVKEKLNIFQTQPRDYLNDLLEEFRKTSDIDIPTHLALSVQSHFSEPEIEKALLSTVPQMAPLPSTSCPQSGRLGKREAEECLLEWEQIEKFNEEKDQNRDPQKVKINSQKFLDYVKTIEDPRVRSQLIEFTDQVLNSAEDHMSKISGSKVDEVTHLINNHKVRNHFSKVYRVSSALNYGIFAKSLLGDILHGDIEGIAVNTGFLAGNYGFGRLASASLVKGLKYAEAGKVMLGNSLKFASPFIGRFLSPLIALDLYNQIQALKAGDQDAIVGIVGDSIFLTIDAVEVGITLLEISGLIGEVSAVTGPIGWALGALVIIGTDIYFAVRKVQKLDQILHLTTGEKWKVGAGSFFSFGLATFDVEHLAQIKVANNELAKKALEAIRQNQNVQRIVIPSAFSNENNKIKMSLNNSFYPNVEASGIKWERVRPEDPVGGMIFCAPQGDWEDPPKGVMAKCVNAIGVADKVTKALNYTLFNLGDGEDYVQGFKDSSNIFRIGKGKKHMIGGEENDVFILEEGTTFRGFPEGIVDGKGGSNVFDFRGLKGDGNDAVAVVFKEDPVEATIVHVTNYSKLDGKPAGGVPTPPTDQTQKLKIFGIDSIMGRENEVDFIYTNCTTKFVDSRGGRSDEADRIYIPHTYEECNHDKVIQLGSNTVVVNEAVTGKFSYFVNEVHSNINCTLKRSDPKGLKGIGNNLIEHKFFINGTFSEIVNFEFQHEKDDYYDIDIRMHFKDKTGNINIFHLDTMLGYGKTEGGIYNIMFYLKDDVQLGYHHNGIYALLKSDLSVDDIIKKYQPIAKDISIFIYAKKEDAMVSIGGDHTDDVLSNDPYYKTYLIGNKGNNFYTVTSGREVLEGPDPPTIPKIEIQRSGNQNHTDTLDLRSLSQQIKNDLGKELVMKHIFKSDSLVLYLYTSDRRSYYIMTSITFKNIANPLNWDSWCNSLQIILNNAPVILKCDEGYQINFGESFDVKTDVRKYEPSNYYTPLPLVFSDQEVIIIQEDDVELYTEVIVKQKLGHNRFLRFEEDLVMTNGFDFNTPAYRPSTIVLKNYYKHPRVFNTLKFTFDDSFVILNAERRKIVSAKKLEDCYNEYDKNSTDIIGLQLRRRRDLGIGTPEEPSSSSEVIESQFSLSSVFGSVVQSLSSVYYTSLTYVQDYYVYMVESKPKHTLNPLRNSRIDFSNGHRVQNDSRILESKPNAASSNENEITFTDVNSTLLLLDTLVRKLNDSKYKQTVEDYLLSPQEQVENKIAHLTSKLELDLGDIVGSIEKQQQRILENLSEE